MILRFNVNYVGLELCQAPKPKSVATHSASGEFFGILLTIHRSVLEIRVIRHKYEIYSHKSIPRNPPVDWQPHGIHPGDRFFTMHGKAKSRFVAAGLRMGRRNGTAPLTRFSSRPRGQFGRR